MNISINEKVVAYLTLLSGLSISAVAVYYSVAGLTTIFAAAVIPIIVMGVSLEVSKLVATVWLKQNWNNSPRSIKVYLISAIVILMFITSIGIFGFLSKSHLDQSVPSGDIVAKIALIDEKILSQKENIDVARKTIKQMDDAVDQTVARSSSEQGIDKATNLRRMQQKERNQLQADIAKAQKEIIELNAEKSPIANNLRKSEAEVGPIKYIAAFFYGNTEQIVLEKAVTWVIVLIIIVFDPLALTLLLASQMSFQKFRELEQAKYEQDDGPLTEEQLKQVAESVVDTPVRESVFKDDLLEDESKPDIVNDHYVQNEEQKESNLWSSTVGTNSITSKEYTKAILEKREESKSAQKE